MSRRILLVLVLAVVAPMVMLLDLPRFSTARFVSSSGAGATVRAAADWTPPTVSLVDPGSPVKGTVTLAATASDAESGVASVAVQYLAPGAATWATVCTDVTAPYSCEWSTSALVDGTYSLRAVASDVAGYTAVSASRTTTVANSVLVLLSDPGADVRGTVPLTATLLNAGTGSFSMRFEYAPAGTTQWKTLCTDSSAPYTCDWVTTGVVNQDYDLRAVAVSGSASYTSAVVAEVLVDNLAPSVTMLDPGSPLSGSVVLAANATDAHSGIATVVLQYAVTGTSTWLEACTVREQPYSCRFDTTRVGDGSYAFRAVATDVAGNVTTSAAVTGRQVDNTVSSVSVLDPGAFLRGVEVVMVDANSTSGVASVRLQRAPAGSGTWTDVCTDTTSPYSCAWDTTTVPDGLYDLRAVLVDALGRSTTSAVVANRRVDNTPFRGVDVQTVNGGSTPGRLEVNDQLVLTFSQELAPGTVVAGWDGAPLAVVLRLRDGNLLNLGNKGDTLDVLRNGSAVALGSVNTREDYIKSGKTVQFNATMVISSVTVGGVPASRVTITTTSAVSAGGLRTVSNSSAMVWTPSSLVRDLSGVVLSNAPVTELGVADREF